MCTQLPLDSPFMFYSSWGLKQSLRCGARHQVQVHRDGARANVERDANAVEVSMLFRARVIEFTWLLTPPAVRLPQGR